MSNIANSMFYIIRCAINGEKPVKSYFDGFTVEDWEKLYKFSGKHDLAHIVGDVLLENGIIDDEMLNKKYRNIAHIALLRYQKSEIELSCIKDCLSQANIPFIPLKGAVIRNVYPKPWLRTSCDIDILIHQEDIEKAKAAFVNNLSYEYKGIYSHDAQFYSSGGVHIELHFTLLEKHKEMKSDELLDDVWSYATLKSGSCYELDYTLIYFYHIAHMAKHFLIGGCGARPFIDLLLMKRKYCIDEEKLLQMLEQSELTAFYNGINKLLNVWFNGAESDEQTEKISQYILYGGVYGNTVTLAIAEQSKSGSKLKTIIKRLFPPIESLKCRYPSLRKYPCLFIFYYIYRIISIPFTGRAKKVANEIRCNNSISKDELQASSDMFKKLGLIR